MRFITWLTDNAAGVTLLFAAVAGAWAGYLRFFPKKSVERATPFPTPPARGGASVVVTNDSGSLTIRDINTGITLEQFTSALETEKLRLLVLQEKSEAFNERERLDIKVQLLETEKRLENAIQSFAEQMSEKDKLKDALSRFHEEFGITRVEEAEKALDRGNTDAAQALLEEAMRRRLSGQGMIANRLSALDQEKNDLRGALAHAVKATELEPDDAYFHICRGHLEVKFYMLPEAERSFRSALALLSPPSLELGQRFGAASLDDSFRIDIANFFSRWRHDSNSAQEVLKPLIDITEKVKWSSEFLGRLSEAQALAEGRISADPPQPVKELYAESATYWNDRGQSLESEGNFDEAHIAYDRSIAIKEAPGFHDKHSAGITFINKAGAYAKQGKYSECRECLNQAEVQLGRDHMYLANSRFNAGRDAIAAFDFPAAQSFLEEAVAISQRAQGEWGSTKLLCLKIMPLVKIKIGDQNGALEILHELLSAAEQGKISLAPTEIDHMRDGISVIEEALRSGKVTDADFLNPNHG